MPYPLKPQTLRLLCTSDPLSLVFLLLPFECRSSSLHRLSRVTIETKNVTCHMSRVTCHMSHVTCHMSQMTCHVPPSPVLNDPLQTLEDASANAWIRTPTHCDTCTHKHTVTHAHTNTLRDRGHELRTLGLLPWLQLHFPRARAFGSNVTRHTSHVTRHASHVTRHTSYVTQHHTITAR